MKIYLVCSGGMSTSLIVEKMKKEAKAQNIACDVEALALSALESHLKNASCILVAPQVKHRLPGIQETAEKHNTPVALIDGTAYGAINAKAVLKQALALIQ